MPNRPLAFSLNADLLRRIEDFRFRYRFPTRTAAIRWLIEHALASGAHPNPNKQDEGQK